MTTENDWLADVRNYWRKDWQAILIAKDFQCVDLYQETSGIFKNIELAFYQICFAEQISEYVD